MRAPCSHRADRSPLCPIPRAALQPDPQGLPTPPPSGHLGAARRRHGVHAHQPHGCHQSSGSGTAATAAHSIHAQHFGPGALPRGCSSVLRLQRCCRGRRGFKKPLRHCLGGWGSPHEVCAEGSVGGCVQSLLWLCDGTPPPLCCLWAYRGEEAHWGGQHSFTKGTLCLANPTAFHKHTAGRTGDGRAADGVILVAVKLLAPSPIASSELN